MLIKNFKVLVYILFDTFSEKEVHCENKRVCFYKLLKVLALRLQMSAVTLAGNLYCVTCKI